MAKKKIKSVKSKSNNKKDLTIYFMPYSEIANLTAIQKIKKIMGIILSKKIIILQGRMSSEEETRLIENSMTLIDNIKGFQGIEIATISGKVEDETIFNKIRTNLARMLVGERDAITIIGPASIVKEMKKDPKKVELMLTKR